MLVERVGTSKATYLKVEKGDPSVSMGVYAMTLFVLDFPNVLAEIAAVRRDETGLLPDTTRLPQRVVLALPAYRALRDTTYTSAEFYEKRAAQDHFLTRVLSKPKLFILGSDDELGAVTA